MSASGPPSYDLAVIQQKVASGDYVVTYSALAGAAVLKFDVHDIKDCILGLDSADFYKSMASMSRAGLMQDVYRPQYLGVNIYLKLQLNDKAVVISFKKDESR